MEKYSIETGIFDRSIPAIVSHVSLGKHGTAIITHSKEVVPLATNRFPLLLFSFFPPLPPFLPTTIECKVEVLTRLMERRTRVKNYFPRFVPVREPIIKITTDLLAFLAGLKRLRPYDVICDGVKRIEGNYFPP